MAKDELSYFDLYDEQRAMRPKYDEHKVSNMVSECLSSPTKAKLILAADGLFLQYAGPRIRKNLEMVQIAVHQNGDALQYVDPQLLTSDPELTARLILSATYGHPCEALCAVVKDKSYIMAVSRKIIELDPNMLAWVCSHMLNNNEAMIEQLRGGIQR